MTSKETQDLDEAELIRRFSRDIQLKATGGCTPFNGDELSEEILYRMKNGRSSKYNQPEPIGDKGENIEGRV